MNEEGVTTTFACEHNYAPLKGKILSTEFDFQNSLLREFPVGLWGRAQFIVQLNLFLLLKVFLELPQ
jgi:hypothetical protein